MRLWLRPVNVLAYFGILILVLVAGIVMTRLQLAQQMNAQHWIHHTRDVLFNLRDTESLLQDAETGQRGYLFTGDARYLGPYNAAITQVSPHLVALAPLIADNPRQVAALDRLRILVGEKLSEMKETIELYREGRQGDARQIVLSDRGRVIMDQVRSVVGGMREEEERLDEERSADYDRRVRLTVTSLYLAGAVGVAGLCLLAWFILRSLHLREQFMRRIREQEEWFRVTLTSIGDGVIATDHEGKVMFMNPLAERLTGKSTEQAVGRPIQEVFPITSEATGKAAENPVEKIIEEGSVVGLANHTVLHADGRRIPIHDSAAAIRNDQDLLVGTVLVFRDVTSERKSQEMLRRTDKLAAAARLAATVAHEINNPLEAVSNLVYLAKTAPGTPARVVAHLSQAEEELARVAHMTQQTLGFYREPQDPVAMELALIMDSVLELFSNKIKAKEITVDRRYKPCPPITGIVGEMRQAMANLISNAVDAVGDDGMISVDIHCAKEREERVAEVAVQDDGPGIPSEIMEKLFEPFFTTKQNVGTGLGLYVTRDIAERHGGTVNVAPSVSTGSMRGARFVMRIPCDRPSQAG